MACDCTYAPRQEDGLWEKSGVRASPHTWLPPAAHRYLPCKAAGRLPPRLIAHNGPPHFPRHRAQLAIMAEWPAGSIALMGHDLSTRSACFCSERRLGGSINIRGGSRGCSRAAWERTTFSDFLRLCMSCDCSMLTVSPSACGVTVLFIS